jgi:hypothetical protein
MSKYLIIIRVDVINNPTKQNDQNQIHINQNISTQNSNENQTNTKGTNIIDFEEK